MNIGVRVSSQMIVLSGYVPGSEIAGSYGNSIFSFVRNPHTILCSDWTSLHSHQKGGFFFSISSPAFVICRLFDDSPSDQWEVVHCCGFDLHFSEKHLSQLILYLLS